MREIRFRGKSLIEQADMDIAEDDWIYGGISINDERVWIDMDYFGNIAVKPNTVGQYTGQKDKNGQEIYEGDRVYVASEDENAFILWDEETARYIIQFEGWCADFDNYYGKELEVIRKHI